jgi:predicted MPP superfamily phosphohydrolase
VTLVAALGGAAAGLLLARGMLEPYLLEEERIDAALPGLPSDWEGDVVALMCDFHIGMPGATERAARRAVERVIAVRPRAALLAGDFVHDDRSAVGRAALLVKRLVDAGIPTYAVLGNHDHAMPTKRSRGDPGLADMLTRALTDAGVRVLENESVALPSRPGGLSLHLVGIGSHTAGEDSPSRALAGLPSGAPRLVMMHHPASFADLPANAAPVALAGHTHGGQVRLPLYPVTRYLTYIKEAAVKTSGWVHDARIDGFGREGNDLYVSRGIGCSVLPLRLFCRPELTLITLRRAR